MKVNVINEINKDPKIHNYLITHSYWFRTLNREPELISSFLSEYKSYERDEKIKKASEFMDSIETISSVISIL